MKKKVYLGLITVPLLAMTSCSFSIYGATVQFDHVESSMEVADSTVNNKTPKEIITTHFNDINWATSGAGKEYKNAQEAISDFETMGQAAAKKDFSDLKIVFGKKGTKTAELTSGGDTRTVNYEHSGEEVVGEYTFKNSKDEVELMIKVANASNKKIERAYVLSYDKTKQTSEIVRFVLTVEFLKTIEGASHIEISYMPILISK